MNYSKFGAFYVFTHHVTLPEMVLFQSGNRYITIEVDLKVDAEDKYLILLKSNFALSFLDEPFLVMILFHNKTQIFDCSSYITAKNIRFYQLNLSPSIIEDYEAEGVIFE